MLHWILDSMPRPVAWNLLSGGAACWQQLRDWKEMGPVQICTAWGWFLLTTPWAGCKGDPGSWGNSGPWWWDVVEAHDLCLSECKASTLERNLETPRGPWDDSNIWVRESWHAGILRHDFNSCLLKAKVTVTVTERGGGDVDITLSRSSPPLQLRTVSPGERL